jgi:tetratricopeptide (TPR) repeat protein
MPRRPLARRLAPAALALAALAAVPAALAAQSKALAEQCDRLENPTRWPQARAQVQAAAQESGDAATFAQGCLAMADEKWDAAARAFERAVNEDGRSAVYHFWLGRAYGEQAQRANMLKQASLARKTKSAFDRAVQLDPDYLDAREGLMQYYLLAPGIMGGSVDKAREQANEVRKRNAYRGGLLAARIAAREKDWGAAAREYQQLATQYADSAAPWSALVLLHAQQQRWDEAFRSVDRWIAAQPGAMAAQYALGRTAAESGDHLDRGEQALRRYLGGYTPKPGEPSLGAAHWRLGMIHERRGQRDAARAEYQTAVSLDPKLKQARDALAKVK